jgi:hypothetical protein
VEKKGRLGGVQVREDFFTSRLAWLMQEHILIWWDGTLMDGIILRNRDCSDLAGDRC